MSRNRRRRQPRPVVSRQLPTSNPGGEVDLAAACQLVIAHAQGRPVAPLIDPHRVADLIGGLAELVAALAGQLGAGPDKPEQLHTLLTDIQAVDRLVEVFGQPPTRPPPT